MFEVPSDLVYDHNTLKAKHKLNLILRAKSIAAKSLFIGDLVDVFLKLSRQKRECRLVQRKLLQLI